MIKASISLALIATLLLTSAVLNAQWVQTNGPPGGGIIMALATDGPNIIAGTRSAGVFISHDNGSTWRQSGVPGGTVLAVAIRGNTLFTGTEQFGVYISTDNGNSWVESNIGLPNHCLINVFIFQDTLLFVGTQYGLYRSADNGGTWTQFDNELTRLHVHSFAIHDTILFAGTDYGAYRSNDRGETWTHINYRLPYDDIWALAIRDTNLYAATNLGVFLSTNEGSSWKAINTGLPDPLVTKALVVTEAGVYTGYGGLFFLPTNGTSWIRADSGLFFNDGIFSLATSNNDVFVSTWTTGIFRSTDNGKYWEQVGPYKTIVNRIVCVNNNIFAATQYRVFRSNNRGESWSNTTLLNNWRQLEYYNPQIGDIAANDSTLFACVTGGLCTSVDNGIAWTPVNTQHAVYFLGINGSNIFGCSDTGLYVSHDNGKTWILRQTELFKFQFPRSYAFRYSDIFLGGLGVIIFSDDDGISWDNRDSGLDNNSTVYSIAVSGDNLIAGLVSNPSAHATEGIFLSTDNGKTWSSIDSGLPQTPIYSLAVKNNIIYAGTGGTGVFLSVNNGRSWIEINTGLRNLDVRCLLITDSDLFAGTNGDGVWRRPLSEIVSSLSLKEIGFTNGFIVNQNYPNPFNPSTTIEFSLPKATDVSLKVYDVLGREIATLASERMNAGTYMKTWNASNIPSGVYFYRLQAGPYTDTKKLILLK